MNTGGQKILDAIETLTAKYMHEKGWSRRRARRKAEAKVGRYLRTAARHVPSAPRPVLQTLGKLRLQEIGRNVMYWLAERGAYLLAGFAMGALFIFLLVN